MLLERNTIKIGCFIIKMQVISRQLKNSKSPTKVWSISTTKQIFSFLIIIIQAFNKSCQWETSIKTEPSICLADIGILSSDQMIFFLSYIVLVKWYKGAAIWPKDWTYGRSQFNLHNVLPNSLVLVGRFILRTFSAVLSSMECQWLETCWWCWWWWWWCDDDDDVDNDFVDDDGDKNPIWV